MDLSILHQLLGRSSDHITTGQECARAIVVFVYGWVMLRIAGRRIFGRWAAIDIVVSMIVGSNLSRILTGNAPMEPTLAATTLLVALHWLGSSLAVFYRPLALLLEGRSLLVARDGRPIEAAMRRQRVTQADIEEAMRGSGVDDLSAVRAATLEPSGKITVLRRPGAT